MQKDFFFFTSTKFEHQATQQQPWEGLLRLVKLSFSLSPFFPSPPLPLIEINLYMRTLHTLSRDPRIMDSVNQSQNVRSGFLPGVRSAFVYISSFSESDAVFCVLFCWVFLWGGGGRGDLGTRFSTYIGYVYCVKRCDFGVLEWRGKTVRVGFLRKSFP